MTASVSGQLVELFDICSEILDSGADDHLSNVHDAGHKLHLFCILTPPWQMKQRKENISSISAYIWCMIQWVWSCSRWGGKD